VRHKRSHEEKRCPWGEVPCGKGGKTCSGSFKSRRRRWPLRKRNVSSHKGKKEELSGKRREKGGPVLLVLKIF